MNFYASSEYLDVVAEVYFRGHRTSVEEVPIGGDVLRVLVVDGKYAITAHLFLDYHEPIRGVDAGTPSRRSGYAEWVVRRVIDMAQWDPDAFEGFTVAPYVDWSGFPTYDDYKAHLVMRQRGLVRERERRGRRLAEHVGRLVFTMDDQQEDVFEFAKLWKGRQLRETRNKDYFAQPKTMEYLSRLREKGLLTSSTLRGEGRLLSLWIGFVYQGVWSGWVFTYDPELRKYSVGHQLLAAMLEESFRLGHREFDFSIGPEDYKMLYATHGRVLGPIGRLPMRRRILASAKQEAKKLAPTLFENASDLKRVVAASVANRTFAQEDRKEIIKHGIALFTGRRE